MTGFCLQSNTIQDHDQSRKVGEGIVTLPRHKKNNHELAPGAEGKFDAVNLSRATDFQENQYNLSRYFPFLL